MDIGLHELGRLSPFLISLAIGLLIGLERERNPSARAGLRTFALVSLSGCLAAMISALTASPWILAAGLLIFGGMMVASYYRDPPEGDPGTTTIAAVVVCYGLGALTWLGEEQIAIVMAILTTLLLYFKPELRLVSHQITRRDLLSVLQFCILSFVVLPLLPDQGFGPYAAINPRHVWWMVILVSGLSLAGYAALRIAGPGRGSLLTGLFGGVASSTATTLAFARRAKDDPAQVPQSARIILIANTVLLLRIVLLVIAIIPVLIQTLVPLLGGAFIAALAYLIWLRHAPDSAPVDTPLEIQNPAEISAAITFGLLYAAILLASAWLTDRVGQQGIYALAAVSGLTDLDAITLSTL
ncbi:MAG: MgtC/SapB family protein, partial [Betaproteobacteria bacterium]|nr:MgtC/SapB family protein [Betaproteobacteria bacterium]